MIPVTKNIFLLYGEKPTRFPYCNCLLIEDKVRAIIDTGLEPDVLKEIRPEQIELVINSHSHPDHINGNSNFTQAKIAIHHLEADSACSIESFARDFGIELWKKLMQIPLTFDVDFDYHGVGMTFKNTEPVRHPGSRVDIEFDDGKIFDLGEVKLTVLHTPGHTPGHSCFYYEKEEILFSADIDLAWSGPWYGYQSADLDDFIASIEKIKKLKPRILIPGHGKIVKEKIDFKIDRFLDFIFEREEKILHLLQQPRSLKELADQHLVYEEHDPPIFRFWEKVMILKHLERLEKRGQVNKSDGYWFKK